jgi:glutamine synthetase
MQPIFADNASGMHCHQSLWRDEKNLFFDADGYALTSELCRWYIGGLLKHAPALMAFVRHPPTPTNGWCPATRLLSTWPCLSATGPLDKNIYDLPPEEARKVQQVPGSLDESLQALEQDHGFLLKGDVFTCAVIETWIDYKREYEIDPVRLRPHPWEFYLYFDIWACSVP